MSGEPVDLEQLNSNLEAQISELEMLQAMFYNPGEMKVDDPNSLKEVKEFLAGNTKQAPSFLDVTVNLVVDNSKFELCINLPHEYPQVEPDLYVRNHKLNKTQHAKINKDLTEFVAGLDRGFPCIYSAVSWLQDNMCNYVVQEEEKAQAPPEKNRSLVRFWIYSHHIYSKSKRKEIQDLAESLHLSGFCMPGKPGIICVEGITTDCVEWWQTIKSMNWKKIFCKITEECKEGRENAFLKFQTFEEKLFQNTNVKCTHMDMTELHKFLEEHKCSYIFKELFGVEVKSSN